MKKLFMVVIAIASLSGCAEMDRMQADWNATHQMNGGYNSLGVGMMQTGLQMMNGKPQPPKMRTNCIDLGVAGVQCETTQY